MKKMVVFTLTLLVLSTIGSQTPFAQVIFEHGGGVTSVAFSPDGALLASGGEDNTVKLWNVQTHTNIATLEGHRDDVNSVSFSPDGTLLASGSYDDTVKLWDVQTHANIATLEGHTGTVWSVSFSPDGTLLASGSSDDTVKFWDVKNHTNIATLEGHRGRGVASVSFSPDGTLLASGGGDDTVKLWDVKNYTNIATLEGHTDVVWSVSFSPDGTILASGSGDETVRLWDVQTHSNIATLEGHGWVVWSVSFSPDGTILASGSGDETVRLWDIKNHTNIATLEGHRGWVGSVAFSPDGTLLASGGGDATVKLWEVAEATLPRSSKLVKISGDSQYGVFGVPLPKPFVVEVRDQYDNPFSDASVTFTVTAGNGKLSERSTVEHITTDVNGRAAIRFTPGYSKKNTVDVSLVGEGFTGNSSAQFNVVTSLYTSATPPETLKGDVNGDGVVNIQDLVLVASSYGQTGENAADVNGDGVVHIYDIIFVAAKLNTNPAAPALRPQDLSILTPVDVKKWLSEAKQLNLTDATSLRGILILEQLLAALIPKETTLLPNFPNPFNPETWIPYRLAEGAFVTLTIYDSAGRVVRTLEIGHRVAAFYENRSKAIHWDGRNEFGEQVASGVYFYHLSTDRSGLSVPHRSDYSTTRRMLILK